MKTFDLTIDRTYFKTIKMSFDVPDNIMTKSDFRNFYLASEELRDKIDENFEKAPLEDPRLGDEIEIYDTKEDGFIYI